jgi:hypothetical protein
MEWNNLPDTIDPRFLELTLFENGMCVFFKDEVLGYLCLPVVAGGFYNVYQIPTNRKAIATNGFNVDLNEDNSVIIFNNMLHSPCNEDITMFAKRLYDLDRTIDVNANAQKTPMLIICDETERLTMKNLYAKYTGNEPVIFGNKNLNPDSIKVIQTGAPYVCDRLYKLKTDIWNEALTYLGISNVTETKKERMLKDEVNRSLGGAFASRKSRLKARNDACKQINEMFGLNISCTFSETDGEETDEVLDNNPLDEAKDGEENE